jgi:tripartite-type tricarboxylate transporter receptor subunit TctC
MKRNAAVTRLAGVALACLSTTALAQDYPAKPVRFILPYAPGSTIDAVVRFVAGQFQARTGQPAVVEYKPGANALVGAQADFARDVESEMRNYEELAAKLGIK